MSDDIDDDPEFQDFERRVRDELVPKLEGSMIGLTLVPKGQADVKFAVELGLMIMMDKPIIAVVAPGVKVPDKLIRVADAIVEVDMSDPAAAGPRLQAAIAQVTAGT